MPLLDVSDVLDDPDFCDTITVTRLTETVDSNGYGVLTPTVFPDITAVVTAGSGDDLLQLPEASRVSGNILVHSRFSLNAETDTTKADVITWQGRTYTVTQCSDWGRFGQGFSRSICTLKNLTETSP